MSSFIASYSTNQSPSTDTFTINQALPNSFFNMTLIESQTTKKIRQWLFDDIFYLITLRYGDWRIQLKCDKYDLDTENPPNRLLIKILEREDFRGNERVANVLLQGLVYTISIDQWFGYFNVDTADKNSLSGGGGGGVVPIVGDNGSDLYLSAAAGGVPVAKPRYQYDCVYQYGGYSAGDPTDGRITFYSPSLLGGSQTTPKPQPKKGKSVGLGSAGGDLVAPLTGPSVLLKFHIVDKTGADNTAFFNRLLYLKDNRPSTYSLILNDANVFSIDADSVIVQETPVVLSWNIGVIPSGIAVNDILRLRLEPTHVIASSDTKGTSNLNENIAVGDVRVRYGNAISTLFGSNTCNFGLSHSIPETSVQGNVTRSNVFGNYITMPSVETLDINTMGHNVTFQFDVTKCANVGSTNTIIHDDCTLIGNGITTTTAGTLHLNTPFATGGAIAGTEFPVPALPAQWLTIVVNGTKLLIPAYLPTP